MRLNWNRRYWKMVLALLFTAFSIEAYPVHHVAEETPWEVPAVHHAKKPLLEPLLPVAVESIFIEEEHQRAPAIELDKMENPVIPSKIIDQKDFNKDKKKFKRVYLLQIGDQLEISLYGYDGAETKRLVRVDPSGYISYLFIEPIYVLGKTIDEVRKEIKTQVSRLYPHVLVSINAVRLIGDQYTIMGEVHLPGTKPVYGEMKVLDALGAAGGFPMRPYRGQLVDYADLDRAFLSRRGDYVPIDFDALVRQGDLSQNIYLRPGDYIYVPSLIHKQVYVLGEVLSPLAYSYLQTASVFEALAWAGGRTERAHDDIVVVRGSLACPSYFILNWRRMRVGCCQDFLLQPGDIVYVPRNDYWWPAEVVRNAIRAFVGAVASTAGDEVFIKLVPDAANISNGSVFINPGVTVTVPPPPP